MTFAIEAVPGESGSNHRPPALLIKPTTRSKSRYLPELLCGAATQARSVGSWIRFT